MIYMIDNYDSFTYNIVQYFGELGQQVVIGRNDQISLQEIEKSNPTHLVISPGPCNPDKAGITLHAIEHFAGKLPILGVCLGHQAIGQVFGATVCHSQSIMHGKTAPIEHDGIGVFTGLPSPFTATRYHSLSLTDIPDCLTVSATSTNKSESHPEIMAIRHKNLPIEGVQFHPESILSEYGHDILRNFIERVA